MEIIITQSQFNSLLKNSLEYEPCVRGGNTQIHPKDILFFEKFYEKYGFLPYPKEMERLGKLVKIGDVYPDHPVAHLTTKSYYLCKSKVFSEIRRIASENLNLILSDTKRGAKRFITNDGKYQLRSIFEVIFYNIFLINGQSDNLKVDSRKFYGKCNELQKEVDFIYNDNDNDKVVVEIAGMKSEEYYDKIKNAMECIKSLGYKTIIYKTKELTKTSSYSDFYKMVCKDFNFPIDDSVLDDLPLLIGHKNLNIEVMKQYIDDNIKDVTQNKNPKKYYQLKMFIKKLYNKSVNEYRKEMGIKQKNR